MYGNILDPTKIPQTERLDESQVKNSAGGYVYQSSDWERFERFVILGATEGNYYFEPRKLVQDNLGPVLACIQQDGAKAVQTILEISESGRAPKNDTAIFTLALCVKHGDPNTKASALAIMHRVCRIGTHLFQFLAECAALNIGWGRAFKRTVADWYLKKPIEKIAYQIVKYGAREKWSHRDVLRLAHPKAEGPLNAMFHCITKGECADGMPPIYEAARKALNGEDVIPLIREFDLPREALPTTVLDKPEVWEALLEKMPYTAMMRNLGKMTSIELLSAGSQAALTVASRLVDAERIEKARIHPLSLMLAAKTYALGHGLRGSLTWSPVPAITKALNTAFEMSFKSAPLMNKRILVAVDTSGSMRGSRTANGLLSLQEAAGCMALSIMREPGAASIAVDTQVYPLDVAGRRLDDVVAELNKHGGGGTDMSLPYLVREEFDLIVTFTDSETWAGRQHTKVAWDGYRGRYPNARAAVVAMTANGYSILPTNRMDVLQVVGFDSALPQVLAAFMGTSLTGSAED